MMRTAERDRQTAAAVPVRGLVKGGSATPRVSRVLSCAAAMITAGGLSGAAYGLTAAQRAGAATSWPAHVFVP